MDSPIVSQLFKQLFSRCSCRQLRSRSNITLSVRHGGYVQQRNLSMSQYRRRLDDAKSNESNWQQRSTIFTPDKLDDYKKYPMVTADQLRGRKERPKRVKMLARDFIEDSLYNPSYGYFSKQAVIFSPGDPFDFNSMKDELEFNRILGQRYTEFEDKLDEKMPNKSRQLWHTPTELFRPYYGDAIARYLIANYKITQYPYHDLIIYEMGAGNGTLMLNILDYIRAAEPSVYDRTKFKIIEISSSLAATQAQRLLSHSASARGHAPKVEIINRSIFEWEQPVPSPCFFLAMEVFDNFAHDVVRYDPRTEQPLQGHVLVDGEGDFFEFYSPQLDPVAARFLRVRHAATDGHYPHPLLHSYYSGGGAAAAAAAAAAGRLLRLARSRLPLMPNLSDAEYLPTRLMQFFDILAKYFPGHRLLTSDFHSLPDAVRGVNAPVVQTRYERRTVPVTTPLVHQGYFDILFPTDFNVMENMYRALTGKLTRVMSHQEFLDSWAYVHETETRSGENPLLSWYKNASVMATL